MEHPQTFLLKKMMGYKENGLESLGHLDAKHVDNIADVMKEFAELTSLEVADRLAKGETLQIGKQVIAIKIIKPKKR